MALARSASDRSVGPDRLDDVEPPTAYRGRNGAEEADDDREEADDDHHRTGLPRDIDAQHVGHRDGDQILDRTAEDQAESATDHADARGFGQDGLEREAAS